MKKQSILALALLFTGVNMINAQTVSFKIKGSDTTLPLAQKESESYMKKDATTNITVTGGGSGVGIAALLDGTTDIAMSSRSMKTDEKLKLHDAGKNIKTTIISYDAISVIVNPSNKISKLTKEQLADIFTGKTKNWKEVGGADMEMVVYSRESSSGTFEFMKEHVMEGKNYSPSALLMPATGAIVQSVSQTPGAIGYVGVAYVEKSVKALKVSYDKGKTYVVPSIENAKNKSYPITRPLYFFYLDKTEKTVKPFVDYILSKTGQDIVLKEGYVPIK